MDYDLKQDYDEMYGISSKKIQINIGKWIIKQWDHVIMMTSEQHYKKFYIVPTNNQKNSLFKTIDFRVYK